MPFRSQAQMRVAFAGGLGQEMKGNALQWLRETPNIQTLPKKVTKQAVRNEVMRRLQTGGGK